MMMINTTTILSDWRHDAATTKLEGVVGRIYGWLESMGGLHHWMEKGMKGDLKALLSLVGLILVLWPVGLSVVVALAATWAWIFWLVVGIVMGVFQMVYSGHQVLMILMDLLGLTLLKTYTSIRRTVLFYFGSSSSAARGRARGGSRKSRRQEWRKALEQAGNYEGFLNIRIEPKQVSSSQTTGMAATFRRSSTSSTSSTTTSRILDAAMPEQDRLESRHHQDSSQNGRIARSMSFDRGTGGRQNNKIVRNRSWNGTTAAAATAAATAEMDPRVAHELGPKVAELLVTTTARLKAARQALEEEQSAPTAESVSHLFYLLSGVVKRNHLNLEDVWVDNCRTVAVTGHYGLCHASRQLIRHLYEEMEKGLDWMAEGPVVLRDLESTTTQSESSSSPPLSSSTMRIKEKSLADFRDRVTVLRKMKQTTGRTALMLSGGGAQAMYHMGVMRALIEANLYKDIKVISGTSGGSIVAAFCALYTAEELLQDIFIPTISTDHPKGSGEMKRQGIRWFPQEWDMILYWLKHGLLVDSDFFKRTCDYYFGDTTFEEAFQKTGKQICINVSASRASEGTAQRLLLNHISTPQVTIASAVAASCALPGVLKPAKLQVKNSNGVLEYFEVDGVEWIDGSVQADLPFQRIATMFAVTSFIVVQVNFHILPFLNKEYHPGKNSFYWRLFQVLEWDIRSRVLNLSRLGLFPRIFGQDVSKVFKQRYHGHLTIVPRFTAMQTIGLKVVSNPTVKDMEGYLKFGQIAAWPYMSAIRNMVRLETALDDCLDRLDARLKNLGYDNADFSAAGGGAHEDVESIASSSNLTGGGGGGGYYGTAASTPRVRIIGRPSAVVTQFHHHHHYHHHQDKLLQKMDCLEQENDSLRNQVDELERLLQENGISMEELCAFNASRQEEEEDCSKLSSASASLAPSEAEQRWKRLLGQLSFDMGD